MKQDKAWYNKAKDKKDKLLMQTKTFAIVTNGLLSSLRYESCKIGINVWKTPKIEFLWCLEYTFGLNSITRNNSHWKWFKEHDT